MDIRSDGTPGLQEHEVSLLLLLDKIFDRSDVEINETGTDCACPPLPPLTCVSSSLSVALIRLLILSLVCSQRRS